MSLRRRRKKRYKKKLTSWAAERQNADSYFFLFIFFFCVVDGRMLFIVLGHKTFVQHVQRALAAATTLVAPLLELVSFVSVENFL